MTKANESGQATKTPAQETTSTPKARPITGEITDDKDFEDPDEANLRRSRAAVEAEEKAQAELNDPEQDAVQIAARAAEEQQQATAPETQPKQEGPQGQPQPAEGGTGDGGDPIMIPKERFDEAVGGARTERDAALAQANYWKGVAEATQANARPAEPAPKPLDYEALLTEQEDALDKAAADFDAGTIQLTEYRKVERVVRSNQDKIRAHRSEAERHAQEQAAAAEAAQQAQNPPKQTSANQESLADTQVLEQQLTDLNAAHPYLHLLEPTHVERLRSMALGDLQAQGKTLPGGAHGTYLLRSEIARLSDAMGPAWFPDFNPSQATPSQGQQPAQQQGQQPLSQTAKDRLAKSSMAGAMPPDTSQMGSGAGGSEGVPSDEQILAMSEDDRQALPPAVRARWLGAAT